MRDEAVVFGELGSLCVSPGYVHALAHLCFRDSVIQYSGDFDPEAMSHLFSADRLIRTETSTLIGLMIKGDVSRNLPTADAMQRYIDLTDALLEEIHRAMSAPAMDELRMCIESGKQVTNPFSKGSNLREPIFYSGESAYSFQFRDIAIPKYEGDDGWLLTHRGFSIRTAHDVIKALIKLQNAKFGREVDRHQGLPPDQWTILPAFTFTIAELSRSSGIDEATVGVVLAPFVLPENDKNLGFNGISDFNAATGTPLISVGAGEFLLFEQYSLVQSLYESPFYWMARINSISTPRRDTAVNLWRLFRPSG